MDKLSRRDFLKLGGIGLAAAAYVGSRYYKILNGLYQPSKDDGSDAEAIEGAIYFIKDNYRVSVYNGPPNMDDMFPFKENIIGDPLTPYELRNGLGLVMDEIIKYPTDYFSKNRIYNIRFLNNVKLNGEDYGEGFGAVHGTLGIAWSKDRIDNDYRRGVFHHELEHGTDWKDNGFKKDDKEWAEIHDFSGKVYWNIEGREAVGDTPPPTSDPDWFLTPYGQVNATEDRAVFAEWMMLSEKHTELLSKILYANDQKTRKILKTKYDLMKDHFYEWSRGKMDEIYWRNLITNKVAFGYFN